MTQLCLLALPLMPLHMEWELLYHTHCLDGTERPPLPLPNTKKVFDWQKEQRDAGEDECPDDLLERGDSGI